MSMPPTLTASPARVRTDMLSLWPCRAMLGLLDRDPEILSDGDALPLGWHWLYFREPKPASAIAVDGHESRGGFMPDVDLPRRMWAGGTLRSLRPVLLGEPAESRSEVRDVSEKTGKSGRLVFVTVGRTVIQDGRVCVEEKQVIVYRDAERVGRGAELGPATELGPAMELGSATEARPATEDGPVTEDRPATEPGSATGTEPPAWTETFLPTTVTLFQFSALTWNAHRIHYDHPYVTEREGYPGLLVHGPLTALLLLDAACRHAPAPPSSFRYRALAPLYVNQPITLAGRSGAPPSQGDTAAAFHDPSANPRIVEALDPTGTAAMRGWFVCQP